MESSERLSDIFPCWEVVFEKQLDLASESGYLIDAVQTKTAAGEPQVDCILLSVIKSNGEKSCVHIDWFTIACSSSEWRVSRLRRLACSVFPDYVAFEGGPFTLAVRSTQPLVPLFDSAKPAINSLTPSSSPVEVVASDLGSTVSRFTWTQSLPSMPQGDSCLLNVLVKLSDNQQLANPKTAIDVVCRPCETSADGANMKFHRLELRVQTDKGSVQLCNARLFAPIRPSNTMWTYDRETNCIDITLVKEEAGTWPRLFAEPDEEMRLGVRYDDESLPAVTTNAPDEPMQSCFNVEQLEDVDMVQEADDEEAVMQRIDGESLKTVLKAEMIGHQKLYVALTSPVESSVNQPSQLLCTRYDVDGLVWAPQPDNQEHPWVHVATLQAFGYVLASKQNRRFVASPPLDVSQFSHVPFVAVTDMSRHVYIYWQPNPTKDSLTELRHRQLNNEELGSGVVHTSWQQVVSLPDAEEVIGFAAVATNPYSACVVATRKNLHLICLDEEDQ
ncbi:unnamed protein product [Mesocestoides corti]|nr:unnamed protein product [Mesocestoides corti]